VLELNDADLVSMLVFLGVFLGTVGAGGLVLARLYGDNRKAVERLRNLSPTGKAGPETAGGETALGGLLPRAGNLLLPSNRDQLAQLKTRLTQAGIYGPNSVKIFLGVKVLLMVLLPATAAVLPLVLELLTWERAVMIGGVACGVGMLTPSFWLDYQREARKNDLRRAIPDTIDMLVLCMEAGVSLIAAFQRVAEELRIVHPGLAKELNIIQREIQLGLSIGDALMKFGDRCDIDEVRNLATVIQQSERYGASSVKALRVHSESCRQERQQKAEEKAQKASVKILFPTLLCIFPAIFIVILGPAAYQIGSMFSKMR
jgi:tight adherence protein C